MKNKLKFLISIFFLYISEVNTFAVEDFIFESKSIEIEENGNIVAKDRVKAITSNGLEIFADKSEYNKNLYNKVIKVYFLKFIRAEKKFKNLEHLRKQIKLDIKQARK